MVRGLPRRELVASVEALQGMLFIPQLLPEFDRFGAFFLTRETRDTHIVVLGNHRGLKLYRGLTLGSCLAQMLVGHRESLFLHAMSPEDRGLLGCPDLELRWVLRQLLPTCDNFTVGRLTFLGYVLFPDVDIDGSIGLVEAALVQSGPLIHLRSIWAHGSDPLQVLGLSYRRVLAIVGFCPSGQRAVQSLAELGASKFMCIFSDGMQRLLLRCGHVLEWLTLVLLAGAMRGGTGIFIALR
jgi:hypothetical protein